MMLIEWFMENPRLHGFIVVFTICACLLAGLMIHEWFKMRNDRRSK